MGLKEEVNDIRKEVSEVKEIKQKSIAWEILSDYKTANANLEKANKKLFIILIIVLTMWFATGCYLVYILNDTGVIEETTTQEITDVDSIDSSNIVNGDYNGKDKTNKDN